MAEERTEIVKPIHVSFGMGREPKKKKTRRAPLALVYHVQLYSFPQSHDVHVAPLDISTEPTAQKSLH